MDRPLSPAQAAAILGVSVTTVYSLCRAGEIRHFRVGLGRGVIRIEPADLDAYRQRSIVVPLPTVEAHRKRDGFSRPAKGFSRLRAAGWKPSGETA